MRLVRRHMCVWPKTITLFVLAKTNMCLCLGWDTCVSWPGQMRVLAKTHMRLGREANASWLSRMCVSGHRTFVSWPWCICLLIKKYMCDGKVHVRLAKTHMCLGQNRCVKTGIWRRKIQIRVRIRSLQKSVGNPLELVFQRCRPNQAILAGSVFPPTLQTNRRFFMFPALKNETWGIVWNMFSRVWRRMEPYLKGPRPLKVWLAPRSC